ncbi:ABC transporter substrate-binding protein [Clostridiales bacterium PH28_bin88]|nr:ABC transporter substrate-binding protein [Clostridiales bacterium PH28_bin88]
MKKGKVLFLGLAVLLLVTLALAGCGGGKTTDGQASKPAEKILVYARGADPRGLDPAYVDDGESAKVIVNIYENLVQYKPNSTDIEPGLATEWSSSEDGKVWTFKLRQGVKFHDGTPFNAQAVKFSVERQLPPNLNDDMPYATFTFGPVDKVEAADEYTVKFYLKEPYAPFLANLAMSLSAPIVSPAAVQKFGADFNQNPVGTGPFKFVKWEKDQQIVLEANKDYWGEKPKVDKVVFKVTKENSVRASELISGAVDIIDGVDPNDVKKLEDSGLKVLKAPGMNINYMGFFTHKKPFNDPKLRQAVSMAVNRKDLVDFLYQGMAKLANGPLPDFMPGYAADLKPYEYNPEDAKKLMAEAGYPNGMKVKMITYVNPRPYNAVGGEKLAAAIQADLLKIGIQTEIVPYQWVEYKQAVKQGEGDLFFYGWIGDNGDPDNFLYALLSSFEIESTLNSAKYSNKQVDDLLVQAQRTSKPEERNKLYHQAQEIILQDAPWVFISHGVDMAATTKNISGYQLHPTGVYPLKGVTKQ